MKSCDKTDTVIKKFLNDEIKGEELSYLKEHNQDCSSCKMKFDKALYLKNLLKAQNPGKYKLPENIRTSFHQKLSALDQKQERYFFTDYFSSWKFAAAAMALFVILLSLGVYFKGGDDKRVEYMSEFTANYERPVTIWLNYTAARDLSNVTFTIELDEGIFFDSRNSAITSLKKHSWNGELKKGKNEIPFTVNVKMKGERIINTRADFMGFSHKHKIKLEAKKDEIRITFIKYSKIKIDA